MQTTTFKTSIFSILFLYFLVSCTGESLSSKCEAALDHALARADSFGAKSKDWNWNNLDGLSDASETYDEMVSEAWRQYRICMDGGAA